MTIEEQLKVKILERYKSIRAFTEAIEIPYSTLDSALKRGISKAGIGTMLKVFTALDLDIESISTGTLQTKKQSPTPELPDAGEPVKAEDVYQMLINLGFVKDGEDLSNDDLRFLLSVGEIIKTWFHSRK